MPAATSSCGKARRQVSGQLKEWKLSHVADDLVLIVSELVGNAIVHGAGPVRVALRLRSRDDITHIRLEVGDRGLGWDGARPAEESDEEQTCGRGLWLIEALSARWGSLRHTRGQTVWAEVADG
ncbi:ATP-binding protein [Streptomyces sp. NPDC002870]|uniref:ATP-binding protein n=1 Tax=Streptomyces sp. NPDC002870 TaxID=3364666 RepID=UPI003684D1F2